jgi:homocysteine S-methyltransferase
MGTILLARGVPSTRAFDELNLTDPRLVGGIHREYIAAGAEVIETNTFGANRVRLAPHGLEARVREINLHGVKIARDAREVAGENVFVAGAMGPLGRPLAEVREVDPQRVRDIFREQAEGLLEGGADLLIAETFGDAEELALAVEGIRAACDLPVVAQLTFDEDGLTLAGQTVVAALERLRDLDIQVVGANCGLGPQATLATIEEMARLSPGKPLSAQPNAGLPARVGGRFLYGAGPDYFGDYARRFAAAGVELIGGCCGTTPAHVRAMHEALRAGGIVREQASPTATARPPTVVLARTAEPVAATGVEEPEPTHLAQLLAEGRWVVSVEIDPPRGLNPAKALRGAAMLREETNVDLVNIPDNPMARVRMAALALAYLISERVGLETIVHMTPRDRNLMALQSELLGAHAHGVRNILAVTGDPGHVGNYPHATGIWDVDSIGLIEVLARLNRGEDSSGASIGRRSGFHIGCALTPPENDEEWDRERERLRRKIAAGAHFIMSQPVYDADAFERFMDYLGPLPIPLLVGVMPLNSYRHAEYLHNEVPGITVPRAIRERMARAGENGQAEGIAMARDFLARVAQRVQGTYLMPSFGRYEVVSEVIRGLPGR